MHTILNRNPMLNVIGVTVPNSEFGITAYQLRPFLHGVLWHYATLFFIFLLAT
jgi:hypothetical protein